MNLERMALEAQQLIDNELLTTTLAGIEKSALDRAVNAKPAENEIRASAMADIRAVRSLTSKLQNLVEENAAKANRKGKPA